MTTVEIVEFLRRRIIADVHLGRLKPGCRLPSLRIVAREIGASIRAVAHAYSELEREGLVKVRGRSGIYLVMPPSIEPHLPEPLDWYADMLKDAWHRRIAVKDLSQTLQKIVENPLKAACVESTEDHMIAFCSELEEDFALDTVSIKLTAEGARIGDKQMTLAEALQNADFAVTTAFHAHVVRAEADKIGIPVVIVSVNDTLVAALEKELQNQPVTMIADDSAFVERMHESLLERFNGSDRLRVVALEEIQKDPNALNGSAAWYTRAARKRLDRKDADGLPQPISFVSETAARKIVQYIMGAHAPQSVS
jgi:DNA-binding transcriptional regulator YhcF (GntR family)